MALTADEMKQLAPGLAPRGVYVEGDDYLLASVINTVPNASVVIGGRLVQPSGRLQPFQDTVIATADRVVATKAIRLGDGWLQELTATVSGAASVTGQTFLRVDIVRGDGAGRHVHGTLLQGPITSFMRAAWPGSLLQTSIGLPGALRSLTGTDPAAGAEIQETVPTGARWRLVSMYFPLVTDATVANREVTLRFDDGTNVYGDFPAGANQAASLTRQYTASSSGVRGAAATGTGIEIAIPPIMLGAGHRISTSTINKQAGDNYGAPQLLVEEWLEGA